MTEKTGWLLYSEDRRVSLFLPDGDERLKDPLLPALRIRTTVLPFEEFLEACARDEG